MAAPYCTIPQIEAHTGLGYDAESQPSRTEVQRIIEGVAREIDGVLQASGYTLPITSPVDAVATLRDYNALGGSYRAWYASVQGTAVFPAVVSWREDYLLFLKNLKEGKTGLPGIDLPVEDIDTQLTEVIIRGVEFTS